MATLPDGRQFAVDDDGFVQVSIPIAVGSETRISVFRGSLPPSEPGTIYRMLKEKYPPEKVAKRDAQRVAKTAALADRR